MRKRWELTEKKSEKTQGENVVEESTSQRRGRVGRVGKRANPPRQPDTCSVEEARVRCRMGDCALRRMSDTGTGLGRPWQPDTRCRKSRMYLISQYKII